MKKLLLAAVAASVAATGFAGTANGSFAAPSAQPAGFAANAYVEGALGYARTNYANAGFASISSTDNHENGGFAGGIDAGYNFMPHLGVEAGFMMPFQKASLKSDTKKHVTTYSFYGAARLSAEVAQNFNVFALAGLGYTHVNNKTGATEVKSTEFGFAGGVGASYTVADNITVGVKYIKFASRTKSTDATNPMFPGPQYYLATVGYSFG